MPKQYDQRLVLNIIEAAVTPNGDDASTTIAETDAGENLKERFDERGLQRNELVAVRVPVPTSQLQANLNKATIVDSVRQIHPMGANSLLYVIAHADPETKRFAGLGAQDWAEILGTGDRFAQVKRIQLVGCHTAGDGVSVDRATSTAGALPYAVTGYFSFAALLHEQLKPLGIRAEIAAYCSYVRISAFGEIRAGFDQNGQRTRHAPATKVIFRWDEENTRSMTFAH